MMEMFDIASVEILKGSQGTLYGRNTTGGAIKVETVKPEPGEPTTGFVGGAVGNCDSVRYEGAVSFPLGDTAAMRIAARHNESDGWGSALTIDPLTGDTTDSTDTNGRDADLVRGSLVWDATENLRLSFDVKAIVAHRDWEFLNVFDVDGSSFDLLSTVLDAGGDQDSVEIQFSGLAFDQKLNWLAGLYYFEESATDATVISFGGNPIDYLGEVAAESAAVFTHLVYAFTDDLSLSAGVRYTEDTKELDGENRLFGTCVYNPSSPGVSPDGCSASFSDDFDFVSWTLGVDWAFADSAMVYAKASQGQRSGGQNIRGSGPAFSPDQQAVVDTTAPFDEESVVDYEVGIKSEFKWGVDVNYTRSVDYGEWNATLGYTWTDERGDISSVSNDSNSFLPMDDYSVVNGRVQLAFHNGITIALFGRNLTDEEYSTNYLNSFLGNPAAGGFLDPDEAGIYAPGAPRTYGAELRYAF